MSFKEVLVGLTATVPREIRTLDGPLHGPVARIPAGAKVMVVTLNHVLWMVESEWGSPRTAEEAQGEDL